MSETYEKSLEEHNNFAECVLLDLWQERCCRRFVLLVDNIWTAPSKMREDLDIIAPAYLYFDDCQRIEINNAFSASVFEYPDLTNWGINEFALIKVTGHTGDWHTFKVFWEGDRYIEVTCRDFRIVVEQLTPQLQEKYGRIYSGLEI